MSQLDIMKIPPDWDKGYYLDVDLIYPPELHNNHNCYPLAPSHKTLTQNHISPHNQEIWEKHHGNKKYQTAKNLYRL